MTIHRLTTNDLTDADRQVAVDLCGTLMEATQMERPKWLPDYLTRAWLAVRDRVLTINREQAGADDQLEHVNGAFLTRGLERATVDLVGRTKDDGRIHVTITWWVDRRHATVVADTPVASHVWVMGGHHDESGACPDWLVALAAVWIPKLQQLAQQGTPALQAVQP